MHAELFIAGYHLGDSNADDNIEIDLKGRLVTFGNKNCIKLKIVCSSGLLCTLK
jgi:hypothetical protein